MTLLTEIQDPSSPASQFLRKRLPTRDMVINTWARHLADSKHLPPDIPWDYRAAVGVTFEMRAGLDLADAPPYPEVLRALPPPELERILRAAGFVSPSRIDPNAEADGLDGWRRMADWDPRTADPELYRDAWYLDELRRLAREPPKLTRLELQGFYRAWRDYWGDRQPHPPVLDGMRAIWDRYLSDSRDRLLALGQPRVIAPLFDDAFALGDFVLGGMLVDFKVYVDPIPNLDEWLDQLLAYALFDVEDAFGIRQVAIYAGWQACLLSWPLDELLCLLAGTSTFDLGAARKDFREAVHPALEKCRLFKYRGR